MVPLPIDNIDTDQIIPARFLKTISKEVSAISSSTTGATTQQAIRSRISS